MATQPITRYNGAEVIALRQFTEAIGGDSPLRYAQEITNRTDGPIVRKVEKTDLNAFEAERLRFERAIDILVEDHGCTRGRKKLHKPEVEKEEKPVLAPEMVSKILLKLPYAHRLFVVMMSVLTIRIGEGLALRWLNLNFVSRVLQLTHS